MNTHHFFSGKTARFLYGIATLFATVLLFEKTAHAATMSPDLNFDGSVNLLDWSIMNSAWGTASTLADLNKDGVVNSLDWSIMNGKWGQISTTSLPMVPTTQNLASLTAYLYALKQYSVQNFGSAAAAPSSILDTMVETARQRKTFLLAAVADDKNAVAVYRSTIRAKQRSTYPANVQQHLEEEKTMQGRLMVLHSDDFQKQTATYQYFLVAADEQFALHFVGPLSQLGFGTNITVDGFVIDRHILTLTPPMTVGSAVAVAPKTGTQRALAVLLNFTDAQAQPFTPMQVQNMLTNKGLESLYSEMSYGKISWNWNVIGWYSIPRASRDQNGVCIRARVYPGYPMEYDEVYGLIKNNIDLSNYDHLLLLDSSNCGGGDSFGTISYELNGTTRNLGIARVGFIDAFNVPVTNARGLTKADIVIGHELGHNLGAWHANGLECGEGNIFGGVCENVEYGSMFDIMGVRTYALHFDASIKDHFSWGSDRMLTIAQSGEYTINPLELSSGVAFAKIKNGTVDEALYLEYRKPYGFDEMLGGTLPNANLTASELENQHGLFIYWRLKESDISGVSSQYLLDMTPLTPQWWGDANHVILLGGLPGDINYDGAITPGDAQLVESYRTGNGELTAFQIKKADVNQDNAITPVDVQCIFDKYLGRSSCLDQAREWNFPVFEDNGIGVRLGPILHTDNSSITFKTALFPPVCEPKNPRMRDPGGDYYTGMSNLFFLIFNDDGLGCAPAKIAFDYIQFPAGWTFIEAEDNAPVSPMRAENLWASFIIPQGTPFGDYSISLRIKNLGSGLSAATTTIVRVVGTN